MAQSSLDGKILCEKKGNKIIEIWIDGSCAPINPGGTGSIGYIIKENGQIISQCSEVVGKGKEMTTNVAEYLALINALDEVKIHGLANANIFVKSDSQLIVYQIIGKNRIKAPSLKPYYRQAMSLVMALDPNLNGFPEKKMKKLID